MIWYVEHRTQVKRLGKIHLVPVTEIQNHFGFRSVYGYNLTTKEHIEVINSTKGLYGVDLYSDTLFLDFDDAPEAADKFEQYLIISNTMYTKWDSGNRSIHYHIPLLEPMIGPNVARIQKNWVSKNAPGADLSFYQPAGMYRLPGTYHHKNPGHCKRLLHEADGNKLSIPLEVPSWHFEQPVMQLDLEDEDYYRILANLITTNIYEGERNRHVWKITKTCANLGMDAYRALDEANFWNKTRCHPALPSDEICHVVRGVYGNNTLA